MELNRMVFALAGLAATGAGFADETNVETIEVPVVKCSSPVHTIAISQVECVASSCGGSTHGGAGMAGLAALLSGTGGVQGVGKGVKSMMTNALKETGCFKIVDLEKFQKMKAMLEATGQEVKPPQIDLFVNGEITAIEVTKSGGAIAGGVVPVLGMFSSHKEEAKMAMDIAVMDPTTLEIGKSRSFSADSSKSSFGFAGFGAAPGGAAGGGWSISKSLALDNVVREVVFSVSNYLADAYAAAKIVSRPEPKAPIEEPIRQTSNTGAGSILDDI